MSKSYYFSVRKFFAYPVMQIVCFRVSTLKMISKRESLVDTGLSRFFIAEKKVVFFGYESISETSGHNVPKSTPTPRNKKI